MRGGAADRPPRVALKIEAIGFRVTSGARRLLECIAAAGGGRYLDAQDAGDLGAQLRALTARALRPYIRRGEPLAAAPAPEAAQPRGAGQYTSELRPGEQAWYAFAVGAGQSVSVSATLPASPAGIPTQLRSELQNERLTAKDNALATNSSDVLTAVTETAVAAADLRRPPRGRLNLRLEADAAAGQTGPYALAVRVTGRVEAARTPAPAASDDDGGVSGGLAGALAAVVGIVAGAALGGRRRRA